MEYSIKELSELALILTVKKTIQSIKGECIMSDKEKFQELEKDILKRKMVLNME